MQCEMHCLENKPQAMPPQPFLTPRWLGPASLVQLLLLTAERPA